MRSTLIYDIPTRLFHWLFAGLFLFSFVIAKTVDDESLVFSYHMLSGILLGLLVIWRIVWGIIGSKHAKFSGFNLNLIELKDYFLGIVTGSKKRWSGHNPASSWASILMFVLALGLAISGYLMSTGLKEDLEDLHEVLANVFIVVVILHIVGIILHSMRHRDLIGFSMIDGKKESFQNIESISNNKVFSAIVLIVLMVSAGTFLFKNFDSEKRTLNMFGQTLQLGESEDEDENEDQNNMKQEANESQVDKEDDDD